MKIMKQRPYIVLFQFGNIQAIHYVSLKIKNLMYKEKMHVFQGTDNIPTPHWFSVNKGQRSNTDVIHKDRSQGLLIIKYSTL